MAEQVLATEKRNLTGGIQVLAESVTEVPSAALELAREAWKHPWETGKHLLKTVGTAAGAGLVLGALIPARGPVAAAVGIAFTFPLAAGTVSKVKEYWQAGQRPGADLEVLGHALAKDFVNTGVELGLSVAGGYVGASAGMRLATSETAVGGALQQAQRAVLRAENRALVGLAKAPELLPGKASQAVTNAAGNEAAMAADVAARGHDSLTQKSWFARPNSQLQQRIAQFDAPTQEYTLRMGSLHGHSRYSDGMGTPAEIFKKAREEGLDFYAITDHNHLAARGGIKEGDPRWVDEQGTPTVAEKPIQYSQTFADAYAATKEGEFVAFVGLEMGTIGKVGGGHAPNGGQRVAVERPVTERPVTERPSIESPAVERPVMEGQPTVQRDMPAQEPNPSGQPGGGAGVPPGGSVAGKARVSEAPGAGGIFAGKEVTPQGIKPQPDRTLKPPAGDPSKLAPRAGTTESSHNTRAGSQNESAAGPDYAHPDEGPLPDFLFDGTPVPKGSILTPREQAIVDLAAREAGHHSGVNHINLFEVPTFFEAVRQPRPQTFGERLWAPIRRLIGLPEPTVVKEPPVVKYNDGDYAALVQHLDQLKDSSGGQPIIQLNHPRYLADHDPNLPAKYRGRDYGVKSFKSQAEWRDKFGKYASQIEVITGQAMNPKPVEHLGERDLGGVNLAGYVDKGLHVSPTYGRDDHFAMPGGRPAGTGIIAHRLDKASLLEAMRQRRTMATTDRQLLNGYTTANDKFVMGTILDQNAVQDITLTAHIGGDLAPTAQYKLTLWGDKKIGDGKLATALDTRELTGLELANLGGRVKFDEIQSLIGKKSAYWVEVQRLAPDGTFSDHMWTAPIWIEPLAGQHSALTKALVGIGSQYLSP